MFALNQLNQKLSLSVSLLPLPDLIDDSNLITKISSPSTFNFHPFLMVRLFMWENTQRGYWEPQ